jgi:hypothetical protein
MQHCDSIVAAATTNANALLGVSVSAIYLSRNPEFVNAEIDQ